MLFKMKYFNPNSQLSLACHWLIFTARFPDNYEQEPFVTVADGVLMDFSSPGLLNIDFCK